MPASKKDDMREYLSDPRVKGAYMAVMTNLTGVPEDQARRVLQPRDRQAGPDGKYSQGMLWHCSRK